MILSLTEILGSDRRLQTSGRDRVQKSLDDRPVDSNSSEAQTPDSPTVEGSAAGTIVTWRGVLAVIVDQQVATTAAASRQPLQQGRTFPDSAGGLLRTGMTVAG